MRLCILNHYAVTPDMPGGTRHFDLRRELVKKGMKWLLAITKPIHVLK